MNSTPFIRWVNPARIIGKAMADSLSPDEMLADFVEHGLITELTGDYSTDVTDMCRNGASWLFAHMKQIGLPVLFVEGTFLGLSHCWVVLNDYYFDMTIAQSDPTYPRFACVLASKAEGYSEFMRMDADQWQRMALKEAS